MSAQVRLHRTKADHLTLHFSPGYGKRAQLLGQLVTEGQTFLSAWLGVEIQVTLSILRHTSWGRLRRAPYGYPHSVPSRSTIFAPAHYPPRLVARLRALYEMAPLGLRQLSCGKSDAIEDQIKMFYDLVAIHELGHLYIHHLQLALGSRWLTELVANLFATAFFVEARPDLLACWRMWAEIQAHLSVPHHTLEAYEQHYTTLDFTNANYYQGRLNKHALALWEQHGRAIAPKLLEQFSQQPEMVAKRFQQVAPEFEW